MKTKPEELAYYLQGFFEITDAKVLTIDQVAKIRAKVESCFEKVTPARTSFGEESKEMKKSVEPQGKVEEVPEIPADGFPCYKISIDPSSNKLEPDNFSSAVLKVGDYAPDGRRLISKNPGVIYSGEIPACGVNQPKWGEVPSVVMGKFDWYKEETQKDSSETLQSEAKPTFNYFSNGIFSSGKEPEKLWTIAGTDIKVSIPSFGGCQSEPGQFLTC